MQAEDVQQMFKDLERPHHTLTTWELWYVGEMALEFQQFGSLTDEQADELRRIWEQKAAVA